MRTSSRKLCVSSVQDCSGVSAVFMQVFKFALYSRQKNVNCMEGSMIHFIIRVYLMIWPNVFTW